MEDYECSVCGATFETKDELSEHIREEHGSSQANEFKCSICGDTFGSEGELEEHIKDDHPSNAED